MLAPLLAGLALATPTVDCAQRAEAEPVSAQQRRTALEQSVRVHGVTFWGVRRAARERFGGRTKFRKSGISARHGAPMVLSIASHDRSWLALRYGEVERAPVLRFRTCAPETPRFTDRRPLGRETSWAGGFVVSRSGCGTLRLRRQGETRWREVRVGFGVRCGREATD
jgi:hypothetical protein